MTNTHALEITSVESPSSSLKEKIYEGGNIVDTMNVIRTMNDAQWQEVLQAAGEDRTLLAFLALYPRFWRREQARSFYRFLEETRPKRLATKLPFPLEGRSEEELKIILPNMPVWQMSYGCTQACKFCDLAAPYPRVDGGESLEHLRADQVEELFKIYYASGRLPNFRFPYWASDLLQHPEVISIVRILVRIRKEEVLITTHLPEGSEENLKTIMKTFGICCDISVTARNIARVRGLDLPGVKLPEKLPTDGSEDVKLRILNHFAKVLPNFRKIHGLGANMMDADNTPEGESGSCMDGVIMTPFGLYSNVAYRIADKHHPFGDIVCPLEELKPISDPSDFISRPVESLLRHVVPVHQFTTVRNCYYLDFKIIDGAGQELCVQTERNKRNIWIVTDLTP